MLADNRGPGQATRRCARLVHRGVNGVLDRLDAGTGHRPDPGPTHAPLLIVGAPRSGSTALYQYLAASFELGVLTNAHCAVYGAPALAQVVLGRRLDLPPQALESVHGTTTGLAGLSECGGFWYRFFPREPHWVDVETLDPAQLVRLRRAVRHLERAWRRPVLFKNLFCSLRMEAIAEALPEARFIVIHRDLADNATSLLQGRRDVSGDLTAWWSLRPEGDDLDDLPPAGQVVEQVGRTYAAIDRAERSMPAGRCLHLRYADMVDEPAQVLDAVADLASAAGTVLRRRSSPAPAPVPSRSQPRHDADLVQAVEDWLGDHAGHRP